MSPSSHPRRGSLLAAALLAAALPAQQPMPIPTTTPNPLAPVPRTVVQDPETSRYRDPNDPMWAKPLRPMQFEGFPVFPSRLLGGYPGQGLPTGPVAPLPVAPPVDPGWPNWLKTRGKPPLPFAPDLAMLVRHADRVWWKAADEEAFVPLYFHDKMQTIGVGGEVEVRQTGEFELLLHTSGRLVATGPISLRLEAMTEAAVSIDVRRFSRMRLDASGRAIVLRLPDGSRLLVPAAPEQGPRQGDPLLVFERAEEPIWHGGRATIFNGGERAVRWQHAYGEAELAPGHRITLFLSPPAPVIAAPVAAEGVEVAVEGDALDCRAAAGGHVAWSGARFALPPGHSLRFEPLQGAPFGGPAGASAGPAAR